MLFIARGTSDNAAVYGRYLLQAHAGRLSTLASPSIATDLPRPGSTWPACWRWRCPSPAATEEIVETLDWAARLRRARRWPSPTAAARRWPRWPTSPSCTAAGAEQAVPATKTFTTQLAALAVLASALGADLDPGLLSASRTRSSGCWPRRPTWRRWSPSWPRRRAWWCPGAGYAYATALELALKLKEACYLHAMGLSCADLLHGPIAVVDAARRRSSWRPAPGRPAGHHRLARRVVAAGARAYGDRRRPGLAAATASRCPVPGCPSGSPRSA